MTVEERVAKTQADLDEFYKDINRVWDENFFEDFDAFAEEHEELAIAQKIRQSDEWNLDDCRRLCELAEIEDELDAADGETFEQVVFKAAKLLHVNIE